MIVDTADILLSPVPNLQYSSSKTSAHIPSHSYQYVPLSTVCSFSQPSLLGE